MNESIINEALEPTTAAGSNYIINSGTMNQQVVYNEGLNRYQGGRDFNMEAGESLPRDFYREQIEHHHSMKWETAEEHRDYKRETPTSHIEHHHHEHDQRLSRDELNATGNWFPGLSGYVAP